MRRPSQLIMLTLMILVLADVVHGQSPDCAPFTLPGDEKKLENSWKTPADKHGNPLRDGNGKPYPERLVTSRFIGLVKASVAHGVDVSKWQTRGEKTWEPFIDFSRLKDCKASFALVRISSVTKGRPFEFREDPGAAGLWARASKAGLLVGPYHFFRLRFTRTDRELLEGSAPSASDVLIKETESMAREHAWRFVDALTKVVKSARDTNIDRVMPIALDVEQEWSDWAWNARFPEKPSTPQEVERKKIGMYRLRHLYSRGICAWVNRVRASDGFPKARFILYTGPSKYDEFSLGRFGANDVGCDFTDFLLWVSWYRRGGQPHYWPKQPKESASTVTNTQAMCLKSKTSEDDPGKCIFHQYAEGGRFAFVPPEPDTGFIDLNRLHLAQGETVDHFTWSLRHSPLFAETAVVGSVTTK